MFETVMGVTLKVRVIQETSAPINSPYLVQDFKGNDGVNRPAITANPEL